MAPKNTGGTAAALLPIAAAAAFPSSAAAFEEPKKAGNRQKMLLPAPKSSSGGSSHIPRTTNKLAESDKRPLNQTFTIAKASSPAAPPPLRRNRANSFDSDFADFGPDVIFGFISRSKCNMKKGAGGSMKLRAEKTCWALAAGWTDSTMGGGGQHQQKGPSAVKKGNGSFCMDGATKLPSLDGFRPGRSCCQLQFSRSNFELYKYKRNIKD